MGKRILLTSFDIWQTHHRSNASDDLVDECLKQNLLPPRTYPVRKLSVNYDTVPVIVRAHIEVVQPDAIVCCGMAETRKYLSLEVCGTQATSSLYTTLDVNWLAIGLPMTRISHDAGQFVCNHLYYSVLKYIQNQRLNSQCLFVHVPRLNESNRSLILHDFVSVLQTIERG